MRRDCEKRNRIGRVDCLLCKFGKEARRSCRVRVASRDEELVYRSGRVVLKVDRVEGHPRRVLFLYTQGLCISPHRLTTRITRPRIHHRTRKEMVDIARWHGLKISENNLC